jgi:hypothetical protein
LPRPRRSYGTLKRDWRRRFFARIAAEASADLALGKLTKCNPAEPERAHVDLREKLDEIKQFVNDK